LRGISGADIAGITMQAPEPLDDVELTLRGKFVFISAKHRANTIPLTANSPAFVDTVNAFVTPISETTGYRPHEQPLGLGRSIVRRQISQS